MGGLLGALPRAMVDPVIDQLRSDNQSNDQAVKTSDVETEAVELSLMRHNSQPPKNLFAPFFVTWEPTSTPLVTHWGNVDSGSMVNIVYSSILEAFPELNKSWEAYQQVVMGVGNKTTSVVGKLVDVSIHLGHPPNAGKAFRTTFYVLECKKYHWILGLHALNSIDAGIFARKGEITYQLDGQPCR